MADLKIDGYDINIPLISLKRKGDFLDKYAERTADGILHRELIGVYINYQLEFGSSLNTADYQQLWDLLTEPKEFHNIEIPDETSGSLIYQAYFSNVSDEFVKISGTSRMFTGLKVNFIAKSPLRTP